MNISLFIPSLQGGGAERVIVALANGLVDLDCRVDLVLGEKKGYYFQDILPEVNVVILNRASVSRSIIPLVKYLRAKKPQFLISALEHANLCALLANSISGENTKTIATVHIPPIEYARNSKSLKYHIVYFLTRFCYRFVDTVVAVSFGVADDLKEKYGLLDRKMRVIYNPVVNNKIFEKANQDVEAGFFNLDGREIIVSIGRLNKQKDYPTLIKSFAMVRKNRNVQLLILGEGEERQYLELLIKDLGLEGDVCLPGFCGNPFPYLRKARLFVLSSAWEALPTVLIEALALGIPVVSTDCRSGPREILKDGLYGDLVPVGESVILADAILKNLERPVQYSATEAVQRFSIEEASNSYLILMRELIDGKRSRGKPIKNQ